MDNRIALLGLLLGTLAHAVDAEFERNQDIVNRAFEAFDRNYREEWAWAETSTEEDIVYVGRYDPRRAQCERWVLESINGAEPTADEIDDRLGSDERGIEQGRFSPRPCEPGFGERETPGGKF